MKAQDANDIYREGGGDTLRRRFEEATEYSAEEWGCRCDPHQADQPSEPAEEGVRLDDFVAHMPSHSYIFKPTREPWPASSVNARVPSPGVVEKGGKLVPIAASAWLDSNRAVEQTTWAPGEPMEIEDRLISEGGWVSRKGCRVLNLYRPPMLIPRAGPVDPWLDHLLRLYPEEAEHIIKWCAHRVQRPNEKCNHALVLGGEQGIGKDTILEPIKRAVGPWNFAEVSPQQMLGRFNGFLKSVIIRISEARDLGDVDRFGFYDHTKAIIAAPPDVLRVDEKHLREYAILNVCGIVITSNHKADGIYLPSDDRRHLVAWSELTQGDFEEGYWAKLYAWFDHGGAEAVAAYLLGLDLSGFNPKAPPPKTHAFWEIVNSNRAPENAEMADALDKLGRPPAVTLLMIKTTADDLFAEWLRDRRNARRIPHRMEECGYVPVRNQHAEDGLWKIEGRRQAVYAPKGLGLRDQLQAAEALARR